MDSLMGRSFLPVTRIFVSFFPSFLCLPNEDERTLAGKGGEINTVK